MAKRTVVKKRELPLVDYLDNKLNVDLLQPTTPFLIPQYIKENLKHTLRPYQENALFNLDYTQRSDQANYQYNQLLFNMATGSGKTDVMAAIILYMYSEYDYQNFLFVVNSNAVVSKTKDNLIHSTSNKYLFKSPININGEKIDIKLIDEFPPYPETGTIYLKLSTIQTIDSELNNTRENAITYKELKKHELIILADEAHHFSAKTKNNKEKQNISWENTLDRIRQGNRKNRQFEFTATLDIQNDDIYNKYKDRVVYRYPLSQFISEGYSKKVFKLQATNDDAEKMLNAVLLNQYRKRIAKKYSIPNFKPIVLFKSNTIPASKKANELFLKTINNLNIRKLNQFIKNQQDNNHSEALKMAYNYWIKQDFAQTIVEIKNDFNEMNIINANDSGKDGILENSNNFHNLNSLEDPENPFRAIFAVAKLSEGWDVLNLYDIVRIGEQPKTLKQTNSEAQLIGRGARYNPFIFNKQKSFVRRFDNKNKELQLLERLYYHTINDAKYLDNLKKSLDKIDLTVEDDSDYDFFKTKIKRGFLKSRTYKYGSIYYNELEDVPENAYKSLADYGINTNSIAEVNMVNSTWETAYNSNKVNDDSHDETRFLFNFKDKRKIVKKAMSKNKFFRFNSLKQYVPTLKSINEFMVSKNWLGNIRLFARVSKETKDLSINKQLIAVEKYLLYIQKQITNNYQRKRGTNKFKAIPIKDVIKDYSKTVHKTVNNNNSNSIEWIKPDPMNGKSWYVYEDAIVDRLEKSAIDIIGSFIDKIKEKYKEVYLLRNDEQNTNFKLHQFQGKIKNYNGFMPDFILYLKNEEYIYQVYIEPKGEQLLNRDKWKEDLLLTINPENIEVIGDNDAIKLYGIKFFLKGDENNIEEELINKNII